jgi:hypothetical protein
LRGPYAQNNAVTVNEVLAQINDAYAQKLHAFTTELLFDRVKVEIELYWASERGPGDA